tara:strand:- start:71073 stop:71927 length:855 start_codon:yes stop_codon:yes gene_type:complete
MNVLVFGKTGQVASELARIAPEARFVGRAEADLTEPAACARLIAESGAKIVINAAAYTAVDRAESEEEIATLINGAAPAAMAAAARRIGAAFVHISTDYVFNGTGKTPWPADVPVGPISAYGRSKLAGEDGVRAAGGTHAILRTSWVFSAHGSNFLKTMVRLAETHDTLRVVADQIGGPTPASDLARAVLEIGRQLVSDRDLSGTYHFSAAPDVSWADFAREIFAKAGRPTKVIDIATADYPTPARRPMNSRLDCSRTETVFGLQRPDWKTGITKILKEMDAMR